MTVVAVLAAGIALGLGCTGAGNQVRAAHAGVETSASRRDLRDVERELAKSLAVQSSVRLEVERIERELVAARARRQERSEVLNAALADLQHLEEDLGAAGTRKQEIEAELARVRELEVELAGRRAEVLQVQQQIVAVTAERDGLASKLALIRQEILAEDAASESRRKELAERLAAARDLVVRLEAALAWTQPPKSPEAPGAPPPLDPNPGAGTSGGESSGGEKKD